MTGLSPQQRALLEQLKAAGPDRGTTTRIVRRPDGAGPAPLSSGQERLLLVDRSGLGVDTLVGRAGLELVGDLDVDALRAGLAALVARHEVLRTAIDDDPVSGLPVQRVLGPAEVRLELPLREATAATVDAVLDEALAGRFDLAHPPAVRAVLVRVVDRPDTWALHLAVHHVAVDAWSVGLLIGELVELYRARRAGDEPRLSPPALRYSDFAAWQRARLASGELDVDAAYWRDTLAGAPLVDVPGDRPRPRTRDQRGASVALMLPPAVVAGARQVADTQRATVFAALVAAWVATLARWSGEPDVTVGTPVAGRSRAELEDVVGFFVNTVPIRPRPDPGGTWTSAVAAARNACVGAFGHQELPFERIVAASGLERDISGQTQLGRHWIALDDTPKTAIALPSLAATPVAPAIDTVRCDLSVQLAPAADGGLAGQLEYSTELFDRETATALADTFVGAVEALAARPDEPVARLLTGVDPDWDLVAPPPPSHHATVVEAFLAAAQRDPDAVAVRADGDAEGVDYAELRRRVVAVSEELAARGVGRGDRVAVSVPPSVARTVALLAVLHRGAVHVPLPLDEPAHRRELLLEVTTPAALLVAADDGATIPTGVVVAVDEVTAATADRAASGDPAVAPGPPGSAAPSDPAYVMFTSGTSGTPKAVVIDHAALTNRLDGMQHAYDLTPADRVLHKAPENFDVSMWELLWPLTVGACSVHVRPGGHRDLDHLHEVVDRYAVTVCHFVPSMLDEFVAEGGDHLPHPSLRLLFSGGETLRPDLADRVARRHPHVVFANQYGPTETTIDVTAGPVVTPATSSVPIGAPVPGVDLLVVGPTGEVQDPRLPGELLVGGRQVAIGYLGRDDDTAARFVAHPLRPAERAYRTGDRVRLRGDAVVFLGRLDDQLKIRGHRVEPAEIEHCLRAVAGVRDAKVLLRRFDEADPLRLVAYLVSAEDTDTVVQAATAALVDTVSAAATPSWFGVLPAWPRTAGGKLDLAALPRPVPAVTVAVEAPVGPTETTLAALCADLLGVEQVGRADSFFDLGGHSLLALRAIARIRAEFGVRVSIAQFFTAPDVRSLGAVVDAAVAAAGDDGPAPAAAIPRLPRRGG